MAFVASGLAQQPSISFEVVSIKSHSPTGSSQGMSMTSNPGTIAYTGVSLQLLIMRAFQLSDADQIVGPSWLGTESYDIVAKLPSGSTAKQVPEMLRVLLTDRFGMKYSRK
jgi:uncharacterized protein (TIGR03435 family)